MLLSLTRRVLTETRPRVVAKFVYNFGVKGVRSVELHKRRRRRGENFPPFLFISSFQLPASLSGLLGGRGGAGGEAVAGRAQSHRLRREEAWQRLLRHPGRRAVHAPPAAGAIHRAPGLLLPGLHERTAHHRRYRARVGAARQRDAAQSIEGSEGERLHRGRISARKTLAGSGLSRHGLLIGVARGVCQTISTRCRKPGSGS